MVNAAKSSDIRASVGIGFVGLGRIGQIAHLDSFYQVKGGHIAAVSDLRPELLARVAEKYAPLSAYANHHELLEDKKVDAVVVVTRRNATAPIVQDCLEAGKHVLSEKPMAHSVSSARKLVEIAARKQLIYAVGFMKRYDPQVAALKVFFDDAMAKGSLGELLTVNGFCHAGDTGAPTSGFEMTNEPRPEGLHLADTGPDWMPRKYWAAFDWFLNVNSHLLNSVRYFFGEPSSLSTVDFTEDNQRTVSLTYPHGLVKLDFAEYSTPGWHEGLEIVFEKGRLKLAFPPPLKAGAIAKIEIETAKEIQQLPPLPDFGQQWSFVRQAQAFVDNIRAESPSISSGEASLNDLTLAEEIWRQSIKAKGN